MGNCASGLNPSFCRKEANNIFRYVVPYQNSADAYKNEGWERSNANGKATNPVNTNWKRYEAFGRHWVNSNRKSVNWMRSADANGHCTNTKKNSDGRLKNTVGRR